MSQSVKLCAKSKSVKYCDVQNIIVLVLNSVQVHNCKQYNSTPNTIFENWLSYLDYSIVHLLQTLRSNTLPDWEGEGAGGYFLKNSTFTELFFIVIHWLNHVSNTAIIDQNLFWKTSKPGSFRGLCPLGPNQGFVLGPTWGIKAVHRPPAFCPPPPPFNRSAMQDSNNNL